MAELRRLSDDCEFGDTLSVMLRDRLVCGIKDERIQRRLLQDTDLTYDKAMSTARAMETAARNAEELQKPASGEEVREVHKTQESRVESQKSKCYRCLGWQFPSAAVISKGCNATSVRKLATSPGHAKANPVASNIAHRNKWARRGRPQRQRPCGGPSESIR